jgi:general secretion pathway protein L
VQTAFFLNQKDQVMSRQILAIDIRNHAIAAVLLSTGLKTSSIEKCAYLPFAENVPPNDALHEALTNLMDQISARGASVVVAMPSDRGIYRSVHMPFKEDKKIRQVLPFEMEPGLPVAVENLVIDYQKNAAGGPGEVLAVAIEQPILQQCLQSFTAAGLTPQLVVPGAFPLVNSVLSLDAQLPEQALLLDVDDQKACLFTLVSGRIAMVRTLPAGLRSGETTSNVEAFAQKVRQTITAFSDAAAIAFKPAAIYVCGPALNEPTTLKLLNRALELPTRPVDLLTYLPKIEVPVHVDNYTPWLLDNALALALVEAGGRPCPAFQRSNSLLRDYWITYRAYVKTPAIIAATILLLGMSGVLMDNYLLQKQVNKLDSAILEVYEQTFPDAARINSAAAVEQMRTRIGELKRGGDEGPTGAQIRNMDILLEISRLVPQEVEVVLDRLMTGDGSVTVSGETAAFNAVDEVKSRLSGSPLFRQVTIASANMDKAGSKVRFKLKIDL